MKACIFTTTIDKKDGGPSRSVPILAKGLSLQGIDVTLMTCSSQNMNTHILEDSSVRLITFPRDISYNELESRILKENFDIIHCQNLWNPLYHKIAKISRNNNIPYIMTPRGCLEPWCLKQKYIKKKIALALYQSKDLNKASCILATSQMESDNIRNIGIKSDIAIIPNGIDVSDYKCRTDYNRVKKQICFISRIHPKKGLEYLIKAWKSVYSTNQDWKIVISGNGEDSYIESLNRLIKAEGVSESIKIIPPVFGKDKYNLYSESALFILPSYSENFGMVIAEAMSCGVPVITTNGTPWQILNTDGLGWCIDLELENLICTLRSALANDLKVLFDMGQKASKFIEKNYHYTSVAKKNIMLYKWLIEGNSKPAFIN